MQKISIIEMNCLGTRQKLMVNENYTNKQIIEISGAGPTAVIRWKKQYLAELMVKHPQV
jgi:transposase